MILLQDNVRCNTSFMTSELLMNYRWQVLDHPAYSPDLATSDYYLLGPLKGHLSGNHFESDDDLIQAVTEIFHSRTQEFYRIGIHDLHIK